MKSNDTFMGTRPGQLVANEGDDVFVFYEGGLTDWYDTWYIGKINDSFIFCARDAYSLSDDPIDGYFSVSEKFKQKKPIRIHCLWSDIHYALCQPANFDILAYVKLNKQKAMHSAFIKNNVNNKAR